MRMSHTVQVNLIADHGISIMGSEINVHNIETIFLDSIGQIYNIKLKHPEYPYLQHGWPCEVWEGDARGCFAKNLIRRFNCFDEKPWFFNEPEHIGNGITFDHYRPIGTEWDFLTEEVEKIKIMDCGEKGIFKPAGYIQYAQTEFTVEHPNIKTVLPKEYYGQTIQRPSWAK